ncbi:MAG: sigma70-ECF: polymerase sigma factor, sigma-70 family [Armatimonadetes bacterium]|jgi:RNA polymerase sigma-70 factor (ECF subfamily)|nr:sigma70-ECF: polymerase sigma factor, sigma-70 family [Armatimonadota bacterium]
MVASDRELMARIGRGDLDALGVLFERHQPALHAFLCRFLGNAAAAEDVGQETFWRVWQYRSTYDGSREFRTWLYVIARHAALDEIRRWDRQARSFSSLPLGEAERIGSGELSEPGSEASVRRLSVRDQVQMALLELPPEQRACLILREYDGRSHREIGEILGCSEANARVMAHRARLAMRKLLHPLMEAERESEESCV